MDNSSLALISSVVFLPTLGALLLAFFPKQNTAAMKWFSLGVTAVVFLLTVYMAMSPSANSGTTQFIQDKAAMQSAFSVPWIKSFDIYYSMGFDGISFPLVILTSFLSMLAMGASWPISKHVKAYCILFLLLETGMLGVFLSLDFFLFYVFWEVMLLPMYFLIGVWGGPRREYAAIKFFLYTLLGSVLMLIAILMLYFNSDLGKLAEKSDLAVVGKSVETAQKSGFKWSELNLDKAVDEQVRDGHGSKLHTFNILALAKMGQHTKLFDGTIAYGKNLQWWAFLLLFLGFAVKVPAVPVHTWLPDAHVEAPTPISMILAGVLLKMGGYGIIRICYPICPHGGYDLAYFVCTVGVVSMVYGAFAAMAQKDFKRLVAYSSVSHMGYVTLGLGVWSANLDHNFDWQYWAQGMNGAMFQMLAHGISSAGMFFMVGVIYDRVHHRNLDQFGGLFGKMPVYTGLAIVIFFAGLGLPGLCGFIGEVFVTLSVWNFNQGLAVISASVVILTAGYILWAIQRVYLGAEYKGPHGDHLTPITSRELAIACPLVALALLFGVYPQAIFNYLTPSVNQEVQELANWTRDVKAPSLGQTGKPKTDVETSVVRPSPAAVDAASSDRLPLSLVETGN